ncbi:hypothetical protein CRG98_004131 [Punica granatum]|uniref:Uncharacterized protein n=1 Tax=Punica granatum TaxID=22663 RepID=A0A2I0L430_PUNGR|nr:hypothetical protein CRG98_004131 [Punica granatum]
MNHKLTAADAISKLIALSGTAFWWVWATYCSSGPKTSGRLNLCVTAFSLARFHNSSRRRRAIDGLDVRISWCDLVIQLGRAYHEVLSLIRPF